MSLRRVLALAPFVAFAQRHISRSKNDSQQWILKMFTASSGHKKGMPYPLVPVFGKEWHKNATAKNATTLNRVMGKGDSIRLESVQ